MRRFETNVNGLMDLLTGSHIFRGEGLYRDRTGRSFDIHTDSKMCTLRVIHHRAVIYSVQTKTAGLIINTQLGLSRMYLTSKDGTVVTIDVPRRISIKQEKQFSYSIYEGKKLPICNLKHRPTEA